MDKTKQVLKLDVNGRKFSVVFHAGNHNPYWVYRHTWTPVAGGPGVAERKRIEVKYADFKSCMYYLLNEV